MKRPVEYDISRICYGCCEYNASVLHILLLDGKLFPAVTSSLYATLARKEHGCGELTVCELSSLSHISVYI